MHIYFLAKLPKASCVYARFNDARRIPRNDAIAWDKLGGHCPRPDDYLVANHCPQHNYRIHADEAPLADYRVGMFAAHEIMGKD